LPGEYRVSGGPSASNGGRNSPLYFLQFAAFQKNHLFYNHIDALSNPHRRLDSDLGVFLAKIGCGVVKGFEPGRGSDPEGFRDFIFCKSHGFGIAISLSLIDIRFLILTSAWIQI
jgi:hypothetical protein